MWPKFKENLTIEGVKKRALKGIKDEVSRGVQYIRTHIDVTDPKFTALKAMLELREELKNIVEIQIVAFPQEGMYTYKVADLVEEALRWVLTLLEESHIMNQLENLVKIYSRHNRACY